MPDPDVLTTAEAATWLRVSTKTLRAAARDGRIPHRRVRSCYRFRRSALEAWLAGDDAPPPKARPAATSPAARRRLPAAWIDRL